MLHVLSWVSLCPVYDNRNEPVRIEPLWHARNRIAEWYFIDIIPGLCWNGLARIVPSHHWNAWGDWG